MFIRKEKNDYYEWAPCPTNAKIPTLKSSERVKGYQDIKIWALVITGLGTYSKLSEVLTHKQYLQCANWVRHFTTVTWKVWVSDILNAKTTRETALWARFTHFHLFSAFSFSKYTLKSIQRTPTHNLEAMETVHKHKPISSSGNGQSTLPNLWS